MQIADLRGHAPARGALQKALLNQIRLDHVFNGVGGFADGGGHVYTTLAPDRLNAVLRGQLRIRQRPGPKNALGDIKFVFPNNNHIYLHHTPAPLLFQRDRRDFSHGCIRIEDPVALARFVLHNDPAWPEPRIREAMARGQSATLRLADPLPVVIAYSTAIVKQGRTSWTIAE